ncbi:MAG: hypothetical protein LUG85_03420 [Clostridiales bacterium]|nr:hypothetical protein [Clostridiales bacterium]MCD7827573.1 hypothetical protein [Clostridiales bacterium]
MKKILNVNIIDIVPFSKGLIFIRRDEQPDGTNKASFFSYDAFSGEFTSVTKGVYLLNKFGMAYEQLTSRLSDFVTCEAVKLPNHHTIVIYPTGEMGQFDENGRLSKMGDLYYSNAPARDAAFDGSSIWCAVPQRNAVIRYSLSTQKIVMRIGGDDNTAFNMPISVSFYADSLFVCNRGSNEIRCINIDTLNVSDYLEFQEPVNKYYRFKDKEIVVLDSGVYEI